KVCGRWKAVTRTLDKTVNPPKVTIALDADQPDIDWVLGPGSDTPQGGFAGLLNEGYAGEAAWNVNLLPLAPGRTYRLQFTMLDGDETKTYGDAAQGCVTVHIPVTVTTTTKTTETPVGAVAPGVGSSEAPASQAG